MSSSSNSSAAHWCKAVIEEAVPTMKTSSSSSSASASASASASLSAAGGGFSSWYSALSHPAPSPSPSASSQSLSHSLSSSTSSVAAAPSAYLAFYQQMYGGAAPSMMMSSGASNSNSTSNSNSINHNSTSASLSVSTPAPVSMSVYPPPPTPPSSIASSSGAAASAPWSNGYYMPQQTNQYNYAGVNSMYSYAAVAATPAHSHAYAPAAATPAPQQYVINATAAAKKPNPTRFAPATEPVVIEKVEEKPKPTKSSLDKQPPSLRDFIRRTIAQCDNEVQRKYVAEELGKLVQKVTAEGRLHVHRWDLESIPTLEDEQPSLIIKPTNSYSTTLKLTLDNSTLSQKQENVPSADSKKRRNRWSELPPSTNLNTAANLNTVVNSNPVVQPQQEPSKRSKLATEQKPIELPDQKMRDMRASRFNKDSADFVALNSSEKVKVHPKKAAPKQAGMEIAPLSEQEIQNLKIVGTCQKLEKDYLRLTSPPLAGMVRPEAVLKKTILFITKKWENKEVDYVYMCSQLKSIRQDLTVQDIKNEFTVEVYETHARVALQSNDLNEYNQCQTQLKLLYSAGLLGQEMEFLAYRILYYVYLQSNKSYTGGSSDMATILSSLTDDALAHRAVSHALEVRTAVFADNYHKFFQLLQIAPNLGKSILNFMIDDMRLKALQRMAKAYRPNVDVEFAVRELGFDNLSKGIAFVKHLGCIVVDNTGEGATGGMWNTKDSTIDVAAIFTQEKLLL